MKSIQLLIVFSLALALTNCFFFDAPNDVVLLKKNLKTGHNQDDCIRNGVRGKCDPLVKGKPDVIKKLKEQFQQLRQLNEQGGLEGEAFHQWLQQNGFLSGPTAPFWNCINEVDQQCHGGVAKYLKHAENMQFHLQEVDEQCLSEKAQAQCEPLITPAMQKDLEQQMKALQELEASGKQLSEEEIEAFLKEHHFLNVPTKPFWECIDKAAQECQAGLDQYFKLAHNFKKTHKQEVNEECMNEKGQAQCQPLVEGHPEVEEALGKQMEALMELEASGKQLSEAEIEQFLTEHKFLDGPTAPFWQCVEKVAQECSAGLEQYFKFAHNYKKTHKQEVDEQCLNEKAEANCSPILEQHPEIQDALQGQMQALQELEASGKQLSESEVEAFLKEHHFLDGPTKPFWECIEHAAEECKVSMDQYFNFVKHYEVRKYSIKKLIAFASKH